MPVRWILVACDQLNEFSSYARKLLASVRAGVNDWQFHTNLLKEHTATTKLMQRTSTMQRKPVEESAVQSEGDFAV